MAADVDECDCDAAEEDRYGGKTETHDGCEAIAHSRYPYCRVDFLDVVQSVVAWWFSVLCQCRQCRQVQASVQELFRGLGAIDVDSTGEKIGSCPQVDAVA